MAICWLMCLLYTTQSHGNDDAFHAPRAAVINQGSHNRCRSRSYSKQSSKYTRKIWQMKCTLRRLNGHFCPMHEQIDWEWNKFYDSDLNHPQYTASTRVTQYVVVFSHFFFIRWRQWWWWLWRRWHKQKSCMSTQPHTKHMLTKCSGNNYQYWMMNNMK